MRIVLTVESLATFLGVVVSDVQTGPNTRPTARVRVAAAAIDQVPLDWNTDVELLSVEGGTPRLLLRGTVCTVEPFDEETLELDIRSWPDLLEDVGTPSIVVRDAPRADLAWSVMMTAGLDPESLSVEGKPELPMEEFRVFAPLYGVTVDTPIMLDRVSLLPSSGAAPMEIPPEFAHLGHPFQACDGIAVVKVSAQTLFDAERTGLAEIDHALGVALLLRRVATANYSAPTPHSYSRQQASATVGRYPVVAVLGRWGRQWLRETRAVRPTADRPEALEVEAAGLPTFADVPEPLRQAVTSWRRATEEPDRVPRLLAFWESLEFYAAGAKVPKRFTRSEIKLLQERAAAGLRPDQVQRVEGLIGDLNSPSLMAKLVHAAASDGVLLSMGDLDVLQRLRRARNHIVHGRSWSIPAHSDLRKGLGIATRLLLARLVQLAQTAERRSSSFSRISDPSKEGGESTGPSSSATFTEDDKRWAEQAAESMMIMMPYLEGGELVPGSERGRIQHLWANAPEHALVIGMMRACDVAIKHLANHFLGGSLNEATAVTAARLAHAKSEDLAGFGPSAYEDGALAVRLMAEAMDRRGPIDFPVDLSTKRVFLAFNAVLVALLFDLAERYGISPTRAAGNLGQEISTIRPKRGSPD